jgi:surface protein
MHGLFEGATHFNSVLSEWDTSSVTDMYGVFATCLSFNTDVSKWNTSSVTNMQAMFVFVESFNGDISKWDVSRVTNMQSTFYGTLSFNRDISSWKVPTDALVTALFGPSKTYFDPTFVAWEGWTATSTFTPTCPELRTAVERWFFDELSTVTGEYFPWAELKQYGPISRWNVTGCTDFEGLFSGTLQDYTTLGNPGLGTGMREWDTSAVTSLKYLAQNSQTFNLASIGDWDTSSVRNFEGVFRGAAEFNQASIGAWDTSSATTMYIMFSKVC